MLERGARAAWPRWAQAAAVVVTAGAVGLVGSAPAAADHEGGTVVNCRANPAALQPAISAAAPAARSSTAIRPAAP
ncbi:hypothetical protein [Streptomyces yangpuensis]|uniref:hypothetical protein n=1 Tax=Streptomyces yangpuensis TaxID=1648182 RepID=UPI003661FA42